MSVPMTGEMVTRFRRGLDRAIESGMPEPTAMTLATVDAAGRPSARTVLLKDVNAHGFVFYTNLESRKARQLAACPEAALVLWWRELYEQVQVEGQVEAVSAAEADAYFATRPRGSQIGAWASRQSAELPDRETLVAAGERYRREFEGREVPRPDVWSGFRVVPRRVEFWYGREHRLHERIEYRLEDGAWTHRLLYP